MCWDEQKWPITIVIWVLGETHVKVQGYCAIPAPCGYKWLEMLRSLQCAMLCELLWYGWPTKILHHFGEFKHIKRSDNMIWWYNTKQTTSCKSYSLFLYLKWCLFFFSILPGCQLSFFLGDNQTQQNAVRTCWELSMMVTKMPSGEVATLRWILKT